MYILTFLFAYIYLICIYVYLYVYTSWNDCVILKTEVSYILPSYIGLRMEIEKIFFVHNLCADSQLISLGNFLSLREFRKSSKL